jgi:hypothetical protein
VNDQPKVSAGFVRDVMYGAIAGWGTGYTDPDEDEGRQWYVDETSEGFFRVNPAETRYGPGQLFQVTVTVTEIKETSDVDTDKTAELESRVARLEDDVKAVVRTPR